MDLNQTNDEKFTDEEMSKVDRLQSDPSSEYYYNDPDNEEGFLDKVKRKLEPYGEDFKGFIEYLFTPSRHFGTGQYNEGGVAKQMDMFGYTDKGVKQEADKFVEEAGDLEKDISKAASFVVPFYESGVNISNVVQEYMKPEKERDYEYIKSQFKDAGQSAAIEGGLLLMGGVAGKYGAKGIKALADKVKQYEIDPTAMSAFGAGAIKKKSVEPLEIGINEALQDGKFLKKYDASIASDMTEKVKNATAGNTRANALINTAVPEGTKVGIRLNLNSKIPDMPKGLDKLQTLHKGSFSGKALSYLPFATVKNVVFSVNQTGRTGIASKIKGIDTPEAKSKFNAMSVDGEYVPNKNLLDSNKDLVEIGFNPGVHHLFIDLKTGQAVRGAKEATVIGDRVFAKGVEYWKKTEAPKPVPTQTGVNIPSDVRYKFKKGGAVMDDQMQMAFMQQGGIKDDGMTKDPVSGNPIPPGSMASEVRDDIPAMLSEGEYVVPADVLRFYGVNFFENLRGQAKSGLQSMEKNGRIGGEPLSQQQIQQNMGQSGVTMQANQGGAVGYYGGGGAIPDTYMDQAKALNPKPFDASQFSTVGGSTFSSNPQAEANSITRTETYINAETNDTRIVRFVSSGSETKIVPESDVQYTRPPYYLQGSSALKKAQQTVPTEGGGSDPKDPPETKPKQPFGIDVDWSDPKAYADSLLEGPDGLPKSVQMLSALAGPLGMVAVGGANAAMTLGKISDLRAAKIVAQAQGDTSTSEYIDKELGKFIKRSPNIVSFLEKAVAPGTSKAKEVLDRLGLDYEEDKEGNITFTERMQELNNRILRETRIFSAAGRKELMTQFEKDRFSGEGKPNVYRPGGIDVALGQGSSSDKDYNAAQAASRAAAAARRAAMQEAQAAGGSSDDIADLKEKYEEAGGTWASGGRAEGGLMTKAKKKK